MTRIKQRGGTFLGIILGVMVGLAVALGVAIYVAKVPVPFVNKNATRTSGQDAAEAEKNKDWDPNAPLRGRNGARAGGGAAGGAVAPAPEPAPIPAPAETRQAGNRSAAVPAPAEVEAPRAAASKPAARTAEKPVDATARPGTAVQIRPSSNDPLGDFAAARAGGQPPAPAATADPFTYFVQAGAFRTTDDAEAQRARLSLMGVQARVTEREQAGRTVYRVRVGPFQNKDAADRVKERLDGNGFDSALVRVQR
ncbi:MAG: SPOR domain-containing protein [Ottowia sp.]|uniref:SPOR domain-containing protein n=1 Tax=Ottowia sp. TaxID=1898956 RepID=UPI0039E4C02C